MSTAGVAPLDWLLDNVGPIARDVTDAAIALGVMAGEDPLDVRTGNAHALAQTGPYTRYLSRDALRGKRFGVPSFVLDDAAVPGQYPLQPETRAAFLKAIQELRTAGATIVLDDSILARSFFKTIDAIKTRPYRLEGLDTFLRNYGPPDYDSAAAYERSVGSALPATITGASPTRSATAPDDPSAASKERIWVQTRLETDPGADATYVEPQRRALAAYTDTLDRLHLDGLVYPAAQMPPPDETLPQDDRLSSGPHSNTGWVNWIGVPAVVVPGGFYPSGLPFGLELSARQWKDGDLLGWAYAYEQATHGRRPPVLVEKGLLPHAKERTAVRPPSGELPQRPSAASVPSLNKLN